MFRCTFPASYPAGSLLTDRQGHYVSTATTSAEAAGIAAQRRGRTGDAVDVQPWGPTVSLNPPAERFYFDGTSYRSVR